MAYVIGFIISLVIAMLTIMAIKPRFSVYNATTDEILYTDFEDGKEFAVFDKRADAIKAAIINHLSFGDSVEVSIGNFRLIEVTSFFKTI